MKKSIGIEQEVYTQRLVQTLFCLFVFYKILMLYHVGRHVLSTSFYSRLGMGQSSRFRGAFAYTLATEQACERKGS